ncbi:MAG: histidinol-phosphatase HisJ family protein [Myxococcales bacterium]|nr:histidinol-phosphatase HisJ family protein [Myxococcales bacterium]
MTPRRAPWRVSLHGGHSGTYCDHAVGTLPDVVAAADHAELRVFGLSEHAPRRHERLLYPEEVAMGWSVETLAAAFDAYAREAAAIARNPPPGLVVLFGVELEATPDDEYVDEARALRDRHGFDFVVGSVHHVDGTLIDGPAAPFERALAARGGLEPLAEAYYERLAEVATNIRPDVIGHFDLIRKNGHRYGDVDTPRTRAAALRALDAVADAACILDLNVAGLRKGLPTPYPAPWIVAEAHARGIPFCFGDDSHGPNQVGVGIEAGRAYLLDNGVDTITTLTRDAAGAVVREVVSLAS